MRSELAEFLDQMQKVADTENVTIAARHIDILEYYFKSKMEPQEAFDWYKMFLKRWNAITDNGKNTQATG